MLYIFGTYIYQLYIMLIRSYDKSSIKLYFFFLYSYKDVLLKS